MLRRRGRRLLRLTEPDAVALVTRVFVQAGVREEMARDAAQMLVLAEMMGISTHGLSRVPDYVDRIRAGGIDPVSVPIMTGPAPALIRVDGQNGLGPAVAIRATRAAMDAARQTGMAAAFCRGSTHLGALAPLLYTAAQKGFAAIFTTNTSPMIAPAGGKSPVLGNAPFGIAIPNPGPDPGGAPVILDIALSVAARSKVRQAAAAGQPIPETWATDAQGIPTTDASEAMKGLMQAIGGTKGANLSLCLDLVAGGLSGAAMLSEIPNANLTPGAQANVGHMFIVIDVARLLPSEVLSGRLADAREMVEASACVDPAVPIRLPGARAVAALNTAKAQGFTPAPGLLAKLTALAEA